MDWTPSQIPDLTGRAYVVTGANSGLGLETARELMRRGARVVLACRSIDKGSAALAELRRDLGLGSGEVRPLDLADLTSVRSFAHNLTDDLTGLDGLVNNAGVMAIPQRTTADGFEMQFGTNHLGHFALTGLLLPLLEKRPQARVITVSSGAHRMGRMRFDDLQSERRYRRWGAYGQSKLANLLFAFELDRRTRRTHLDVWSIAAHPGYAATHLQAVGPEMSGRRLSARAMDVLNRFVAQDAARGAIPQLFAATAPRAERGGYYGPDGLMEQRGSHPKLVGASRRARDEASARQLWEESEALTGVSYDLV